MCMTVASLSCTWASQTRLHVMRLQCLSCRGVVRLFNAVSKAQRDQKDALVGGSRSRVSTAPSSSSNQVISDYFIDQSNRKSWQIHSVIKLSAVVSFYIIATMHQASPRGEA